MASGTRDEIEVLKEQLESVREEFRQFTYTLSHDLGAPLRAVVSFSRLLERRYEGTLDDKGAHYLKFIIDGGEKMQSMLTELVQYSRLDTQATPPRLVETAAAVGQCHTALKQKIAASKGNIHVHGTLPEIVMDPGQCFRLFLALIDNGLTYHAPGVAPQVHIEVQDMGEAWKFTVRDNGIGIAPVNAARIFGVFQRLHTDEEYPGIGMGLAMARKIVLRHGGAIGVSPSENGGSAFWFTTPKTMPLPEVAYG